MIDNNFFKSRYFEWLCKQAIPNECLRKEYSNLLGCLYEINYYANFEMDNNRITDGIDLRYRFARSISIYNTIEVDNLCQYEQCSMLEMMLALCIRMEESIMYDPDKGDRTHVWFEHMLKSLGILEESNDLFSRQRIEFKISQFLEGQYSVDGGGLFILRNKKIDLNKYDLWYQMNLYTEQLDAMGV